LPVVVEHAGLLQLPQQAVALGSQVDDLAAAGVEEAVAALRVGLSGEGVGLSVQGLPRDSASSGEPGDIPAGAAEDGVGAGEAVGKG
jgi:hypothetical protein